MFWKFTRRNQKSEKLFLNNQVCFEIKSNLKLVVESVGAQLTKLVV